MVLEDLGKTPVSEQAPAGEDARYEPEYASLLAEIEKLASITRGGVISWPAVIESASTILASKSKDLQAACYLAVALTETQGMAGVVTGTRILSDFCATFWQTGFPDVKRLRGRINALDWWRERVLAFLTLAGDGPTISTALYQRVREELEVLDTILGDVLPDYQPLRDLKEAARHLPSEQEMQPQEALTPVVSEGVSEGVSAPEPAAAAGVPPEQRLAKSSRTTAQSVGVNAPPVPVVLAEDAADARTQFFEYTLRYAYFGHRANPADPLPWRALRLAVWGKLAGMPPSEGNSTLVPAPDMDRKPFWQGQLGKGADALLVTALAVEDVFPTAVFWLDLQRITATALAGLGNEFAPAAQAVGLETVSLLARLPGLEGKTFADGTPFADAETRAWLSALSTAGGANPKQSLDVKNQYTEVLACAESRYAAGELGEALDCLDVALLHTHAGAARLALRLAQARLLCRAGEWLGAAALADDLLAELDRRDLPSWDQDLTLRVLFVVRESFEGLGGETGLARALEVGRRINRLAPSAGLRRAERIGS